MKTDNCDNCAEIKARLMDFIKSKKISKSEFERRCGLSNGYLNSTRGNFGAQKLERMLAAFPELSRDWLLDGKEPEGPSFENPVSPLPSDSLKTEEEQQAALWAIQEVTEMRKLLESTLVSSNAQMNKLIDINAEQSRSLVCVLDKLAQRL